MDLMEMVQEFRMLCLFSVLIRARLTTLIVCKSTGRSGRHWMFQWFRSRLLRDGQGVMALQKLRSFTHQIWAMYDGRQFQASCTSKYVPSTYLSSPQKQKRSLVFFFLCFFKNIFWVWSLVNTQEEIELVVHLFFFFCGRTSCANKRQDGLPYTYQLPVDIRMLPGFSWNNVQRWIRRCISMGRGFITQMASKWVKHGQTILAKQCAIMVTLVETMTLPNRLAACVELAIFQKLVPLI